MNGNTEKMNCQSNIFILIRLQEIRLNFIKEVLEKKEASLEKRNMERMEARWQKNFKNEKC
jgi:hypothetical protein